MLILNKQMQGYKGQFCMWTWLGLRCPDLLSSILLDIAVKLALDEISI